jgi:hypothetical protein
VANVEKILKEMKSNPKGVRFNDLRKVCETFFGAPRQKSTSHFKTPWAGDPRVNIQSKMNDGT